jgi:hypothetical protein
MGNKNMADGLSPHRIQNRRKMPVIIRTRINDSNISMAHDKCIRALEGERAGVVAGNSSKKGRKLNSLSERRFKIGIEFDIIHNAKVMVAPANQPN